jgi:hypothetical protein
MHNITNVHQIPLKISAPFTSDNAAVAPPTHSSMFAHQIREGATPNNKTKNKNKKKPGQRPSSAPSSRSQPTAPSTTQQQQDDVHTSDTFRHTYSGRNGGGGGGGGSSSGFDQDVNITGEGDSMMMDGTMAYASGSATNVVRTRKQQEQRGGSSNTGFATQQAHSNNEAGEDDKLLDTGDVNTGELESEELLINRLPAVGLQAYDTLCKVLAHLEPADRVKVVECVLIDSSEINKSQRDQQQHKL